MSRVSGAPLRLKLVLIISLDYLSPLISITTALSSKYSMRSLTVTDVLSFLSPSLQKNLFAMRVRLIV